MAKYYELVEQTSTTTGTGAYEMTGAVDGRRAWTDVDGGAVVPYGAVDSAGGWEYGIGTWDHVNGELARTLVLSSSNSNNAVNWSAGTRSVFITPSAALMVLATMKHNLNAGAAPTASDDETAGYDTGSFWIYGSDISVCTDPSTSAAVWTKLAAVSGGKLPLDGAYTDGRETSSIDHTLNPVQGHIYSGGTDVNIMEGGMWAAGGAEEEAFFSMIGPPNYLNLALIPYDCVFALDALVTAAGETDRKAWAVKVGGQKIGTTVTLGTPEITELFETAGSTAWTVNVAVFPYNPSFGTGVDFSVTADTDGTPTKHGLAYKILTSPVPGA